MPVVGENLWRLNQEYARRIGLARMYLGLLTELITVRGRSDDHELLPALHYTRAQLEALHEEHRHWRYTFLYESLETRRLVQTRGALWRALARFNEMRLVHAARLRDLTDYLAGLPRPHLDTTLVPTGDLWELSAAAFSDLARFGEFARAYEAV